jgi:hypothetical protein
VANTKLHINLQQGVIDVEGEEGFVKDVYQHFRDLLVKPEKGEDSTHIEKSESGKTSNSEDEAPSRKAVLKRARTVKVVKSSDPDAPKPGKYVPSLDKTLDLSKLNDFTSKHAIKTQVERILAYATFLRDVLGKETCTCDQIFTCYKSEREKMPKAFVQAFRDASKKNGYIDFDSINKISVSIMGDNHMLDLASKVDA